MATLEHRTLSGRVSGRRRGMALVLVVIATSVAMVLSMAFLYEQSTAAQMDRNICNAAQARAIAETGVQLTAAYIQYTVNWRTLKTPGTWVTSQSFGGGTFTANVRDGWDSNGDGTIEGNSDFSDITHAVTIKVTSSYKGAVGSAAVVMTPQGEIIRNVVSASGSISLEGWNTLIDSYDSTAGAYGGSNVGSAASVATNATSLGCVTVWLIARIKGSVLVGPGGNVSTAVIAPSGSITGSKTALATAVSVPTVTAPTGMPASVGDRSYQGNGTTTISSNLHCNKLTIKSNARLKIQGNVTILCEDLVTIQSSGAGIEVLPGGSLKLYFRRGLTIASGANNYCTGGNLSRLQFLNLGTDTVTLQDQSSTSGVIISPNAGVVMKTGFDWFGAIVAKTLSMTGGAQLHQDTNITMGGDPVSIGSGGNSFALRWLNGF